MRWVAGALVLLLTGLQAQEAVLPDPLIQQLSDTLIDGVILQRDYDALDIAQIQHDLTRLSRLLPLSTEPALQAHARAVRALTYHVLNDVRYARELPENTQQIAIAMDDLAWALPKLPKGQFRNEVLYRGGLLAQNSANQPAIAARYWQACAWDGHAGCLNIMAEYSLTGQHGIERSVRHAVYFDQQVVQLGRVFHCAAIYSSIRLVSTTYFWPDVSSQQNWLGWLDVVQQFAVPEGNVANAKNECRAFGIQTQSYVFSRKAGKNVAQQLELAARFIDDEAQMPLLEWLQDSGSAQTAMSAVPKLPDLLLQCEAAWVMLLHSHFTHQSVPYRFALNKLKSSEECVEGKLVRRLLTERKLPPF